MYYQEGTKGIRLDLDIACGLEKDNFVFLRMVSLCCHAWRQVQGVHLQGFGVLLTVVQEGLARSTYLVVLTVHAGADALSVGLVLVYG